MKRKIWIPIAVIALLILIMPNHHESFDDGGTKIYTAPAYNVVRWHRAYNEEIYSKTRVYFFPNNLKSIDTLWEKELDDIKAKNSFTAKIISISDSNVVVEPIESEKERSSSDRISFSSNGLADIDASAGSYVRITYIGEIAESYPAQINAIAWEITNDLRAIDYTESYINKETSEKKDGEETENIKITRIYKNCFFAKKVSSFYQEIKLNGSLPEKWCVGDLVNCTYENIYTDQATEKIEADAVKIEAISKRKENLYDKPVIYLYPEGAVDVSVQLGLNGKLTCTYPEYNDVWQVTATPDGTLIDKSGKTYNYLYWEGEICSDLTITDGFCVKGSETAEFLEESLEKLGLNRREANEFTVYWLPLMQSNPYNIISFDTEEYTESSKLIISPTPDTVIRVFMTWKPSDTWVGLESQTLTAPERTGFTVVEWGGTRLE